MSGLEITIVVWQTDEGENRLITDVWQATTVDSVLDKLRRELECLVPGSYKLTLKEQP